MSYLGIRNAGLKNLNLKIGFSLLLTVFRAGTGVDSSGGGVTSITAASLCNLCRSHFVLGGAL